MKSIERVSVKNTANGFHGTLVQTEDSWLAHLLRGASGFFGFKMLSRVLGFLSTLALPAFNMPSAPTVARLDALVPKESLERAVRKCVRSSPLSAHSLGLSRFRTDVLQEKGCEFSASFR